MLSVSLEGGIFRFVAVLDALEAMSENRKIKDKKC